MESGVGFGLVMMMGRRGRKGVDGERAREGKRREEEKGTV